MLLLLLLQPLSVQKKYLYVRFSFCCCCFCYFCSLSLTFTMQPTNCVVVVVVVAPVVFVLSWWPIVLALLHLFVVFNRTHKHKSHIPVTHTTTPPHRHFTTCCCSFSFLLTPRICNREKQRISLACIRSLGAAAAATVYTCGKTFICGYFK